MIEADILLNSPASLAIENFGGKERKTGNSRLHRCLYFPEMVAIKYNPVIRMFYRRLIENGKLRW